jgi:hypothetical protein
MTVCSVETGIGILLSLRLAGCVRNLQTRAVSTAFCTGANKVGKQVVVVILLLLLIIIIIIVVVVLVVVVVAEAVTVLQVVVLVVVIVVVVVAAVAVVVVVVIKNIMRNMFGNIKAVPRVEAG